MGEVGCVERADVGLGGQQVPLCPSEFPALKLLDFPQKVATLSQVTIHRTDPGHQGSQQTPASQCQLFLGLRRLLKVPGSTLYPPPPSHIFGWVTKLAGNSTPA